MPNLAATQRRVELNAEAQTYFDLGYLATTDGRFFEEGRFQRRMGAAVNQQARDFFISAHFK